MQTSSNIKILMILIMCSAAQINLRCFYYFPQDYIAFNLKNLNDLNVKTFPYTIRIDNVAISGTLSLNLCGEMAVPPKCSDSGKLSHAFFVSDDGAVCVNLISATTTENAYEFLSNSSNDEKTKGFSIKKLSGNFVLSFKCNPAADAPKLIPGENGYTVESKDACGYLNESARLFYENRIVLSVALIIFGII